MMNPFAGPDPFSTLAPDMTQLFQTMSAEVKVMSQNISSSIKNTTQSFSVFAQNSVNQFNKTTNSINQLNKQLQSLGSFSAQAAKAAQASRAFFSVAERGFGSFTANIQGYTAKISQAITGGLSVVIGKVSGLKNSFIDLAAGIVTPRAQKMGTGMSGPGQTFTNPFTRLQQKLLQDFENLKSSFNKLPDVLDPQMLKARLDFATSTIKTGFQNIGETIKVNVKGMFANIGIGQAFSKLKNSFIDFAAGIVTPRAQKMGTGMSGPGQTFTNPFTRLQQKLLQDFENLKSSFNKLPDVFDPQMLKARFDFATSTIKTGFQNIGETIKFNAKGMFANTGIGQAFSKMADQIREKMKDFNSVTPTRKMTWKDYYGPNAKPNPNAAGMGSSNPHQGANFYNKNNFGLGTVGRTFEPSPLFKEIQNSAKKSAAELDDYFKKATGSMNSMNEIITAIAVNAVPMLTVAFANLVNPLLVPELMMIFPRLTAQIAMLKNTLFNTSAIAAFGPARGSLITLLSVLAKTLPPSFLLQKTLNAITLPAKIYMDFLKLKTLIIAIKNDIQLAITDQFTVAASTLRSTSSLVTSGTFLPPMAMPQGPNLYNMFDKQQGVESAIQFEKTTRMLKAMNTVSGDSSASFSKLSSQMLDASVNSGTMIEDVVTLAESFKGNGVEIEKNQELFNKFSNLSKIYGVSAAGIVDNVMDINSGFGAVDQSIGETTDSIAAFALKNGLQLQSFTKNLAYIAPTARQAGQSLESVLSVMTALRQNQGTTEGGAAVVTSNLIDQFSRAAAGETKQVDLLKSLGIDKGQITDANGDLLQITDLIRMLKSAVNEGNNSGELNRELAKLAGGASGLRTLNAVLSLTDEELTNVFNSSLNTAGTTDKIAAAANQGLLPTLERINSSAVSVSTVIGNSLTPVISFLLKPFEFVAVATSKFYTALNLLPGPLNRVMIGVSVLVPAMLAYFNLTKIYIRYLALQKVAMELISGQYTVHALGVKMAGEAIAVFNAAKLTMLTAWSSAMGVLTGKMTLNAAASKLMGQANYLLGANIREHIETSKKAAIMMGKQIIGLIKWAAVIYGVVYAFGELTRRSEGAIETKKIEEATNKYREFLKVQQSGKSGGFIESVQASIQKFGDDTGKLGFVEATRQQLVQLNANIWNKGVVNEYGEAWRGVSAAQVGAQQAMIALGDTYDLGNQELSKGVSILQKYGLETFEASDKDNLSAQQKAEFTKEIGENIASLEEYLTVLRNVNPQTESQKALNQANIKITEKQINVNRIRMSQIFGETEAIKEQVFSLEALNKTHQKQIDLIELANSADKLALAKRGLKEKLSPEKKEELTAEIEKTNLKDKDAAIQQQRNKLAVARVGAKPEDVENIDKQSNDLLKESTDIRTKLIESEIELREKRKQKIKSSYEEENSLTEKNQEIWLKIHTNSLTTLLAQGKITQEQFEKDSMGLQESSAKISIGKEKEKQKRLSEMLKNGTIERKEYDQLILESKERISDKEKDLADISIESAKKAAEKQQKIQEELEAAAKKRIEENIARLELYMSKLTALSGLKIAKLDTEKIQVDRQSAVTSGVNEEKNLVNTAIIDKLKYQKEVAQLQKDEIAQSRIGEEINKRMIEGIQIENQQKLESLNISKRQQDIEMQKSKVSAQLAVAEAQAAISKLQISNASQKEMEVAQINLKTKEIELKNIESQKLTNDLIHSQSLKTLETQLSTGLEKERQSQLLAQQTKELESQKKIEEDKIKLIETQVNLKKADLDIDIERLNMQSKMMELSGGVDKGNSEVEQLSLSIIKQQLEYEKEMNNLLGNTTKEKEISAKISEVELEQLNLSFKEKQNSLKLSIQQQKIETSRLKIQGQIALLEAEANYQKAVVNKESKAELNSLLRIVQLRKDSLVAIDKQSALTQTIQGIEEKKLTLDQKLSLEKIQQTKHLNQIKDQNEKIKKQSKDITDENKQINVQGDLAVKNLEKQSQGLERNKKLVDEYLNRYTKLNEAAANAAKAQLDYNNTVGENQVGRMDKALDMIKKINDEKTLEPVKEELKNQMGAMGLRSDATEADVLKRKIEAENALAQNKLNSLKMEQELSRTLLEIDLKRQEISLKQMAIEAQILEQKARQAGDKNAMKLAGDQAKLAAEGIEDLQKLGEQARKALDWQQQAQNQDFDNDEFMRGLKNREDLAGAGGDPNFVPMPKMPKDSMVPTEIPKFDKGPDFDKLQDRLKDQDASEEDIQGKMEPMGSMVTAPENLAPTNIKNETTNNNTINEIKPNITVISDNPVSDANKVLQGLIEANSGY